MRFPTKPPPRILDVARARVARALRRRSVWFLGMALTLLASAACSQRLATLNGISAATPPSTIAAPQAAIPTSPSSPNQGIVDINTRLGQPGVSAAGTGMVLTSNGEVLTNNHVIDGATQINVTVVTTGRTYTASVVGYDVTNDVAVIQMHGASGLQTVVLGDSSAVKVGDAVTAVGNAQGAGGLPTQSPGKITALNQSITARDPAAGASENLTGMIATDARLQEGDSGGPLLNSSNRVIGMDTAASSSFGGYSLEVNGTDGYAIPINTAVRIANQIVAGKESSTVHIGSTGFLGVEVAPRNGFRQGSGALVVGVEPGTPAAGAGIQAGDTIVSLGGKTVQTGSGLSELMASTHSGQSISVGWFDQSGAQHSATVKLASGPPQ